MAVNLGQAFIQITPTTKGMQKDITSALKGLGRLGESAGKDIGSGMSKMVKGAGKKMAANVGLELDDEADKAGKSFGTKFSSSLGTIGFGGVAGVAMQAAQVLTGGLSSIASEAVAASDATDKFKQTMNFAGLDTSAIDRATKDAQVYADRTVYELGDIQNMTAQLAANGIKDFTALGEAAGNLNAVAGGNADTFKSVGMVMTQTAGQGKLTTENWNQLSDAIPGASGRIQEALEKAGAYTGNFRDAMSKGEITAEEFNAAVMEIGSEPIAVEAAQSTSTFEGMIGNLQAALTGSLADAFTTLKPHIETAISGLTKAAETVLPALVNGLDSAINGLTSFGGLLQQNKEWVGPLAAAITGAATAVGLWYGAIKAWSIATKIATGIQAAFTAVMNANPIMLTIAAITALVAGLFWFFTKTETGKRLWGEFTQFLGDSIEKAKAFFADAGAKISDFFTGVGEKIDAAKAWFGGLKDSVSQNMEAVGGWFSDKGNQIKDFFTGMSEWPGQAKDAWGSFTDEVGSRWSSFADDVTSRAGEIRDNAMEGLRSKVSEVGGFFSEKLTGMGLDFSAFQTVAGNVKEYVNNVVFEPLKAAIDLVKAVFSGDTEQMGAAFGRFRDSIHGAVETIKARINNLVDHFKQAPGRIKGAFSNAGNWLKEAGRAIIRGLGAGIRSMSGHIGDAVRAVVPDNLERFVPGLHLGGMLPAFARGGVLPTVPGISPSERDPIVGWSSEKKLPIARVEPGEFIINRAATKKYLPLLTAINSGRMRPAMGDWGLPRFAEGGMVTAKQVLDFVAGKNVDGKQAPRSLEGAKYVWGGGLLGNWGDCSAMVSGVSAFIRGIALAGRKFATMSEGAWLSAHGFKRGTSSGRNAFEVGFFNGGPWGGHTASTVYDDAGKAINLEMGGGRGNGQIGGRAAGARHSQFTDRYWTELGGVGSGASVSSTSVDGVTVEENGKAREVGWGSANGLFELAKKGLLKIYDTGGLLRHGQLAMNLSGRAEQVMTAMQWDKLVAGLTELADAVREGNLSYKWIEDRFGSRASDLTMEATGGALGGWTAQTKLLEDAEKGLAEVRRKATSESEAVKKAEENLKKVKDKNAIDLQVAREKNGSDEKKMKAAQQRATDAVRKAELQLEQARQQATSSTGKYAGELKAAEQAVEAARKASISAGFNQGANVQAFAAGGSLKDFLGVVEAVGGLGEKIGHMGQGFKLATGAASAFLTSAGSIKKAYDEQADASAALAGAEADLANARAEGDSAAVAEAEDALAKARKTASTVAAATGHAEVSAVINVAGAVVDIFKGIWDWAVDLRNRIWQARIDSYESQASSYGLIAQWQQALADQQRTLTSLMVAHQMAIIEVTEAQRQLRVANWGVRIAEVAGIRQVASAAEKLWDYEKSQRSLQLAGHQDLSKAYDRFRWNAMQAGEEATGAVEQTRQWRSLAFDVWKESAEADKKRLEAQKGQVQAFQNAAETTLKMQRTQEDILRQQKLVSTMAEQAGMSLKAATIGQEIARVNKQVAEMEEWYSRFGNRVRTLGTSAVNLGIDNKWGQANKAYWKRHDELTQYLTKLTGKTGAPTGMAELEEWRKLNQDLARSGSDAAKYIASPGTSSQIALDSFKLEKSLSDQQTAEIENLRKLQDLELAKRFTEALAPIAEKISGYGQLAEAFGAFADAERTDSQKLRDALLQEGQVKLAAAEALRTTPVQVSNPYEVTLPDMPDPAPVTLVGNNFDADAVEKLLVQLGHEVDRLKDTRPSPVAVMAAKRTMR